MEPQAKSQARCTKQKLRAVASCDAGHILGSSIIELLAGGRKLVFSGDLGPKKTPIPRDLSSIDSVNLVLMESTYGDRLHRDCESTIAELGGILDAWKQNGNGPISAFAVGRVDEGAKRVWAGKPKRLTHRACSHMRRRLRDVVRQGEVLTCTRGRNPRR